MEENAESNLDPKRHSVHINKSLNHFTVVVQNDYDGHAEILYSAKPSQLSLENVEFFESDKIPFSNPLEEQTPTEQFLANPDEYFWNIFLTDTRYKITDIIQIQDGTIEFELFDQRGEWGYFYATITDTPEYSN